MVGGPTLQTESALFTAGYRTVAGMDEVGRGALAGPVCVGVVIVDDATPTPPRHRLG
jgi:ribonuclease HII